LGGGIVIKSNAAQSYATDGFSAAVFEEICKRAEVPFQPFANRSDQRGGATLGSISDTKVPIKTIDIGMAQLAMHSCLETCATADVAYFTDAVTAFYNTTLHVDGDTVKIC
jgi:aspartyl aminopeptidase